MSEARRAIKYVHRTPSSYLRRGTSCHRDGLAPWGFTRGLDRPIRMQHDGDRALGAVEECRGMEDDEQVFHKALVRWVQPEGGS